MKQYTVRFSIKGQVQSRQIGASCANDAAKFLKAEKPEAQIVGTPQEVK